MFPPKDQQEARAESIVPEHKSEIIKDDLLESLNNILEIEETSIKFDITSMEYHDIRLIENKIRKSHKFKKRIKKSR